MSGSTEQTRPEFLTVRELAELLRIKERKVYDLASSGAVPCSKVTGKLLFPQDEVRAWIASAATPGEVADRNRPLIFLGSHDPLLDWALRQSQCGIATYFDGSFDGLDRFVSGEGIATGLHIFDPLTDDWNLSAVTQRIRAQNVVLVSFARRSRGLILRASGADRIRGLGDLAGRRLVPRQQESGTHALFDHLCRQQGVDLDDVALLEPARSEADAVQTVHAGAADATFGLEALAAPYGLDFIPVTEEKFDLLIDRKAWFDPPMQSLLQFLRSSRFEAHAATFAGYDLSDLGQVRWNA